MSTCSRRHFLTGLAVAGSGAWTWAGPPKRPLRLRAVDATFEREKLVKPFGFKGGYLTALWQTAARLESASGQSAVGLGTQSVLWSDASVFNHQSEAGDYQHGQLADGFRRQQAMVAFVENHSRQQQQGEGVDESSQHAGAVKAVGLDLVGRLGGEVETEAGQQQSEGVGEIVGGVGEESETACVQSGEHFDDYEDDGDGEGPD